MVYHEIRIVNGEKKNYLIHNERENKKWIKKGKFIGRGEISKAKVDQMKKDFELEIISNKEYDYLKREQVEETEYLRRAYFEKVKRMHKEEFEQFESSFSTELTYNSNAIEGSSLSLQETSLLINENISPAGKTIREVYEAKNHAEALNLIKQYKGQITEELVLKLHSIILKNISEHFAGRYRENQVRIFGSDARFPDSAIVPQLMKNLIYWYNKNKKKLHPFELATIFSMKFVSIHPFIDGNGRISRLLMNFILIKNKYPKINVYNKQRAEYLKAVRKANEEDFSLIIDFLIRTLRENLESFGFV